MDTVLKCAHMKVTVREFRMKLSEYVRQAAAGVPVTVTRHGHDVALLEVNAAAEEGSTQLREGAALYVADPAAEAGRSFGVRALKTDMAAALERVGRGEELIVTERGLEVARLRPAGSGTAILPARLRRLLATEGVEWKGPLRLEGLPPVARLTPGKGTLAELVSEPRD